MCKIIVYTDYFEIKTKIVSDKVLESNILNMIDSDSSKYALIDIFDAKNATFNDHVEHAVILFNRIVMEYFQDYVNLAVVKDDNRPSNNIFVLAPIFSKESAFVRTDRITVTDEFIDFVIGFFRDRSLNIVPLAGTDPVRFIIVK